MFIEGIFGGLMYLIVALIFTIFFLWFIFDFYSYLLKSGKYEMIKQDHSLFDFVWIILFKKEFPLSKKKHFEYEIKKEDNFVDFNSIDKENKNEITKDTNASKKEISQDKLEDKKTSNYEIIEKTNNNQDEKLEQNENIKNKILTENTKPTNKTNNNEQIKTETNNLIERVNKFIRKIENILENDYSKEFKPSFYYNDIEIKSLSELVEALNQMSEDEFKKYVNKSKNDFYNWIKDVVKDYELAKEINHIDNKKEMSLLIKKRYEYFIYLREELSSIKIIMNSIENSGIISKNAKLADLIYTIETIPINYLDYKTEINSIIQYMHLADLRKLSYDNVIKTLESMGFGKHLIKVSFQIKN